MAGAVGCLHGVESLVDLLLCDTLYLGADGGYGGRLGREVAHDGEDGRGRVPAPLAEDVRALLAHEDHRAREGAKDRDGVVSVAQEEAALL